MPGSCLRLCKFLRKRRRDRDACLASFLHLHRLPRQEPVEGRLVLFAVQWMQVGTHGYPVHDTGVFLCRMLSSEMHGLSDTHYKIKEALLIRDLQPFLNEKTLPFSICMLFLLYATSTFPIMHLICPQPEFCRSIVFNFSWDGCNTQEKIQRLCKILSGK